MEFESSDDCEITTLPWLLVYRIIKWNFQKSERSALFFILNEENTVGNIFLNLIISSKNEQFS